jgi:integrase
MLSFAVEEGLIPSNPATGIKQFKLKTHDRFLSQSELERLGETLVKSEQSGISPYAIAAIRFMALTGCRKNEALLLRRSWIDFERRLVKYPDSKTGQKVMRIGAAAVDLVSSLPQVAGCPLVFASAAGGEIPLSIGKIWRKLRSEADLQDLRLHDLRHNFASAAVSSGQTLHVVAKLLGHSQTHTTERYAHLSNDPIREAAEMISAAMADRLSGAKSEETPSSTPRE